MLEGSLLKEQVFASIMRLKRNAAGGPGYLLSPIASEPTVMSLCFAVLTAELYNDIPEEAREWERALSAVQDPETGLFIDPLLSSEDLEPSGPGKEYSIYQTTYFALNALDALGVRPWYPLVFVEPFYDFGYLEGWLSGLEWSDPWQESNRIMFIGGALYHRWHWEGDQTSLRALHRMLDWLDAHQDPGSGFWGIEAGASRLRAMAGAYHFLPFYFSLKRPAHFPERIIENTLSLQQPDGLFHPDGGGDSCLDVDAIDLLVKCSLVTPYLSSQVESALERAFYGLLDNQSPGGGFCRARQKPLPPKSRKRLVGEVIGLDRILRKPYRPPRDIRYYDGWRKMPYDVRQSDLFSTWFRSFGVALITTRYPDKYPLHLPWRFHRAPALGWHDAAKIVATAQSAHLAL